MKPDIVTPFEKRKNSRAVVLGVAAVAGGMWFTSLALDAIHSGTPISMLHGPALEGLPALGCRVFAVAVGFGVVGLGLGWIKSRR